MESLGINLINLIIYTLLFVIVYLLLEKYLLPSLRKNIAERKKLLADIADREKHVETLTGKYETEAGKKEKALLAEAKSKADEIVEGAEKEAAEIVERAKVKSQNYLNDAKAAFENRNKELEAQFNQKVKETAARVAELAYGEKGNVDSALVNKVIAEMK